MALQFAKASGYDVTGVGPSQFLQGNEWRVLVNAADPLPTVPLC